MFPISVIVLVCLTFALSIPSNSGEQSEADDRAHLKPFLNKKYELAHSDDNFEKLLKALGIDQQLIKEALLAHPVLELTLEGDEYTLSLKWLSRDMRSTFKVGHEFTEVTLDGRKVKTVFLQDKNKLTQIQRGDKTTTIIREFDLDKVTATVKVDDIVSVRLYKAV